MFILDFFQIIPAKSTSGARASVSLFSVQNVSYEEQRYNFYAKKTQTASISITRLPSFTFRDTGRPNSLLNGGPSEFASSSETARTSSVFGCPRTEPVRDSIIPAYCWKDEVTAARQPPKGNRFESNSPSRSNLNSLINEMRSALSLPSTVPPIFSQMNKSSAVNDSNNDIVFKQNGDSSLKPEDKPLSAPVDTASKTAAKNSFNFCIKSHLEPPLASQIFRNESEYCQEKKSNGIVANSTKSNNTTANLPHTLSHSFNIQTDPQIATDSTFQKLNKETGYYQEITSKGFMGNASRPSLKPKTQTGFNPKPHSSANTLREDLLASSSSSQSSSDLGAIATDPASPPDDSCKTATADLRPFADPKPARDCAFRNSQLDPQIAIVSAFQKLNNETGYYQEITSKGFNGRETSKEKCQVSTTNASRSSAFQFRSKTQTTASHDPSVRPKSPRVSNNKTL